MVSPRPRRARGRCLPGITRMIVSHVGGSCSWRLAAGGWQRAAGSPVRRRVGDTTCRAWETRLLHASALALPAFRSPLFVLRLPFPFLLPSSPQPRQVAAVRKPQRGEVLRRDPELVGDAVDLGLFVDAGAAVGGRHLEQAPHERELLLVAGGLAELADDEEVGGAGLHAG